MASRLTPERRFRYLARTPRPREPLELRITKRPNEQLFAVALAASELGEVFDMPPEQQASALLLRACWTDAAPRFASANEAEQLDAAEFDRLDRAVRAALRLCCPTYDDRMVAELQCATVAPINWRLADLMVNSCDIAVGYGRATYVERPERYYGVPSCSITDGQLMVYRAARRAADR